MLPPCISLGEHHGERHKTRDPRDREGGRQSAACSGLSISMRAKPARLNSAIAWLFVLGATCFALGTIPAFVDAVGAAADATTFFVGSIFFTSVSYFQLVQAQSPGMTGVDEQRASMPASGPCRGHGCPTTRAGWWRPQATKKPSSRRPEFPADLATLAAADAQSPGWQKLLSWRRCCPD
jgi:hypothetical protein